MPKAKLNYTDRLVVLRQQQAVEKEKRAKEKKRLAAMTPEQQAAEEARQTDREARRELKKMLAAGVDIESTYAGSKGVRGMRVLALFREANGNSQDAGSARLNPAPDDRPPGYSIRVEDKQHLIFFNDEPTGKYALSAGRAKELAAKMARRNGKGRKQS